MNTFTIEVRTMIRIAICVGSACHLRGAHGVLEAFKNLIDKYQVQTKVDLEGSFCQGHCTEGVVVRIDDELFTNVSRENVYDLFMRKVMARV